MDPIPPERTMAQGYTQVGIVCSHVRRGRHGGNGCQIAISLMWIFGCMCLISLNRAHLTQPYLG